MFLKNDKKELDELVDLMLNKYQHVVNVDDGKNLPIEKVLEHVAEYYESIIRCMPGNVYWLDKNCVSVGCNQNVLDMFGFNSITEFKGLTFEEMGKIGNWLPEATQSFKRDTEEVIRSGIAKLNIEEPPIPHNDGSVIYFLSSRVPIFDQKGLVIGVVGISINITERKQMEENLRITKRKAQAASRAKTLFLANISHDIKTPIAGIIASSDYLAHQFKDTEFEMRAKSIMQSGMSLLDFMNEVINLSSASLLDAPMQNECFSLHHLVNSIINLIKPSIEQKGLNLTVNFDQKSPDVFIGNRLNLYRIFLNLVGNAIKFTQEGSICVSITFEEESNSQVIMKVTITDTGIGIPKDKQEYIFEPFARLNPSYDGLYQGNGLGLSIVKQFVEDMCGQISVKSEMGQGSKFTFVVPLKKSSPEKNDLTNEIDLSKVPIPKDFFTPSISQQKLKKNKPDLYRGNQKSSIKILLVEDNLIAARAIKDNLESLGCEIDTAYTGGEALGLFEVGKYHLVYMDLGLPDLDGIEVAKVFRKIEARGKGRTPIIALSAHIDRNIEITCLESGMDMVFCKPLLREQAQQVLNSLSI